LRVICAYSALRQRFRAGLQWMLNRQQIEAGRAIERTTAEAAAAEARRTANEVQRSIDAVGDDELERLRRKWTHE
jgi:hypothetical protein